MNPKILQLAHSGIQQLKPYAPGKPLSELEREYGITDAVKLASNESPFAPANSVMTAIKNHMAELNRYPDGNGFELKAKLAAKHQLQQTQISLGNGSNDILELAARTFVSAGDEVIFSQHSFAVYPIVTMAVNGSMQIATALPPNHSSQPYGHDLSAMLELVNKRSKLIFIANPNNPTGTYLSIAQIKEFMSSLPETVIVVIDEAYYEYVEQQDYASALELIVEYPNLIVTRTFSKAYGLPGLRIGYGLSQPAIADCLNRVRQPFNVNYLAQVAAIAALDDKAYLKQAIDNNRQQMEFLKQEFTDLNLDYIPSVGNFICVKVATDDAAPIYLKLLEQGIIVRPVASYDLPQYLRVSIGTKTENERFIAALKIALGA